MKKTTRVISLIICLFMLFSFAGCKKEEANNDANESTVASTTEEDKVAKNRTVKFELPIGMIDKKYRNDLDAYCEANGFISAKLNKRTQTVTIKMKSFSHELLLGNIGMTVLKSINEIASSKKYPSVKQIKKINTDDFSEVTILVDSRQYKKDGDSAPYVIGQSCLLYQLYAGVKNYSCTVNVVDQKTNQVIDQKVYTDKD
ncbi:MAG: hypothetical protein NC110_04110 [Ruminococcus sp.]|nr:hypothetical protein [Ruminococcus sp.]